MGIDVKGHINRDFEPRMVQDFLSHLGAKQVSTESTIDYIVFRFEYKNDFRQMMFHWGLGLFGSNLVTMGKDPDGCADEIISQMVEAFSGVYIPNDCDEEGIEIFTDTNSSDAAYNNCDALFVHKWAISNGNIQGSTHEDMKEAQHKFEEKILGRIL